MGKICPFNNSLLFVDIVTSDVNRADSRSNSNASEIVSSSQLVPSNPSEATLLLKELLD